MGNGREMEVSDQGEARFHKYDICKKSQAVEGINNYRKTVIDNIYHDKMFHLSMHFRACIPILFCLVVMACGQSNTVPSSEQGEAGQVRSPVSFVLKRQDEPDLEVRLAEVNAPADETVAAFARARLSTLLEEAGDGLELVFTGAERDRYGRAVAHAVHGPADGRVWIQGVMVGEGLLLTASRPDNRARVHDLLTLEQDAREAGRGGWGTGGLTVRDTDPNRLAQHLDSFQIVQGRVIDVGSARSGRVYLNFGLDWRTDFTAAIHGSSLDDFGEDFDPQSLEGHTVRVRGWLYRENGPMMAIDHPEAIEMVEE